MTPDQIDAIRTFARGLPSDGTAPDTAILQLAWDYEDLQSQLAAANERADELQAVVDAARAQAPSATIVEIDDGLGTTFLDFNEPRGPAGTNYYAAPVPAQPAHYRWTQDQIDEARANASELFNGAASKPLAEDQPAVVPEGFVEWLCHEMRPGTVIANPKWWAPKIYRAMLAAILSTTDTEGRKDD